MTAIEKIGTELRKLGYSAKSLARNYRFSDILSEGAPAREVALAAFTDTPFSYRNAAFGVIETSEDPSQTILSHRALGASVWLCITDDRVEVWNTENNRAPRCTGHRPLSALAELFTENKDQWIPDRIHTAKMAGIWDSPTQLSLIDYGLLRSIESGVQTHLDRIIRETLKTLIPSESSRSADYQKAYRVCFYLLAAKILQDREHPVSKRWDSQDAESVLRTIEDHYRLSYVAHRGPAIAKKRISQAWELLRTELSFANISADDLAFVYENTLVAPETRKQLGTHSTPRAVAEFLVSRLQLGNAGIDTPKIYEPYCGAGVLLVAALSAIKGRVPREWSESKRHAFLVKHLRGSDIDPFACEVASLSLVLADYPSANGWDIRHEDLFSEGELEEQLEPGMVVLCNPPFEAFTHGEREHYTEMSTLSVHKPIAVIKKVLVSKPEAIGFVMPHAVIGDKQYGELRKALEGYFESIELIALPDRIFVESEVESALLVAKKPRRVEGVASTNLSSATVGDTSRNAFLDGAYYPEFRHKVKVNTCAEDAGNLWVSEFAELWDYLAGYPTLGTIAEFHRGIEWQSGYQRKAVSSVKKSGYRLGLHSSKELLQFAPPQPVYLDCREENLRGGALGHSWDIPKVVINAVRKSRGPWRIAACIDRTGWVLSQQLIGCWVSGGEERTLKLMEAVLNSPIASAFVFDTNPRKGFKLGNIQNIPIPNKLDVDELCLLVDEIHEISQLFELAAPDKNERIEQTLLALDAALLSAYQLPAKLERKLLSYFQGAKRPVSGVFSQYPISDSGMALSLKESLAGRFEKNKGRWIREVFQPLPDSERNALVSFL